MLIQPNKTNSVLRQFERKQEFLHTLEINPKLLAKLPKKKFARSLSVTNSLRKLKKDYWWFHANAIVLELPCKAMHRKTVLIVSTLTNYRVRVETWPYAGGGTFFIKEYDCNHGQRLLWLMVQDQILDSSFLPPAEAHGGLPLSEL